MRARNFYKRAVWAILPAILVIYCQWLADSKADTATSIFYSINIIQVNKTNAIYIRLINNANFDIDDVSYFFSQHNIIVLEYDKTRLLKQNKQLAGTLKANSQLEIFVVMLGNAPITKIDILDNITAKTQMRDPTSGNLVWEDIRLRSNSFLSLIPYNTYLFWFSIPIIATFLLYGLYFSFRHAFFRRRP